LRLGGGYSGNGGVSIRLRKIQLLRAHDKLFDHPDGALVVGFGLRFRSFRFV